VKHPEYCIFDHIDAQNGPVTDLYRSRLEFAAAVEDAGFTGYYIAEHHSTPLGHAPSPNVFLSALAQRTTRIRIGAMVYVLPIYEPLRLFEEICMLDHMSDGRLDVGVGRGASPFETGLFGVCVQESRDIFEEALSVLQQGFASDTLAHRGHFYRYYDVPLTMRPKQAGGPPIWYGAFSERNLEFAAKRGLNVTLNGPPSRLRHLKTRYHEIWSEMHAGKPLPRVSSLYQMFVGETDAEAERIAGDAFTLWYQSMTHLWRANNASPRPSLPTTFAEANRLGVFIAGSAATVRDRLQAILDESGLDRLLLQCNMGDMPQQEALASLHRFQAGVMGNLRTVDPAPIHQALAS
jgi:alkanesulfonate monooxygenase SsuD/methylene tetrahydromethanopterin reductase-like flavin-dependent oxidoreductase (luciferase family)